MFIDLSNSEHVKFFDLAEKIRVFVQKERSSLVLYANSSRAKQSYVNKRNRELHLFSLFTELSENMVMSANELSLLNANHFSSVIRENDFRRKVMEIPYMCRAYEEYSQVRCAHYLRQKLAKMPKIILDE